MALQESNEPELTPPEVVRGWKRVAFLSCAGVFFALGVAGLVLPLLPGTPFFLLTSYFLVRSSPALNRRLVQSKWIGPVLRDWQQRRGVRRDVKVKSIVIVCLVIGVTIYLKQDSIPFCIAVLGLAAIGIAVILRLRTID